MTWIAVLKVDDLGRRPLLIGGVSGIVGIPSQFKLTDSYYAATCHMQMVIWFSLIAVGPFSSSPFCLL